MTARQGRGLRLRITISFAVGGLLVSAALALITYQLAQRYLLAQRERSAERQAFVDARVLRDALATPAVDVQDALTAIEIPAGRAVVVRRAGQWFGDSVAFRRSDVPRSLRSLVENGDAGQQRTEALDGPVLVIGLPIPSVGVTYYEAFSLDELAGTLAVIRNSLVGAAVATTVAAGLLGIWAGRRVLEPLRDVSAAATDIAEGHLSRRITPVDDRDLAPLTTSFNRMVDALQERIERDERFASDVSHELRSPLTTMAAAREVLEARIDEMPERARAPLTLLLEETERFERLVTELLELARSDSGVSAVELEPVRLGELALHAVSGLDAPSFVVTIDPTLAQNPVLTDKRRVTRILANLIENACAHGGGVTALSIRRSGGMIRCEVDDAGEGVPAEERELVFERFFRGAASGKREGGSGTGLGLALVAEHVDRLGGRVWVEEAPAGGARFVVEIPLSEP